MLSLVVYNYLERWIESSSSPYKCPLCRTPAGYALVRGTANILGQSVPRASGDDGGSDTRMPFCTVVQIMKSIILTMTLKFFPLCCSTALDCELKMSRYFSSSVITCMR